ncbi:CDGSH iron-sulfur domain-containing protein [Streptomyces sp. NPDC059452]|uniref:CDGSH iron-sulfur domain-containing protein n=1 Tax=Streptomyces sp. NPDC059452 TaxID=3346835 RepID=UPI0036D123B3
MPSSPDRPDRPDRFDRTARTTRVTLGAEGPLLVEGPVEVVGDDGTRYISRRFTAAICTCRRTRTYPWCDTSHRRRVKPEREPAADETGTDEADETGTDEADETDGAA